MEFRGYMSKGHRADEKDKCFFFHPGLSDTAYSVLLTLLS